MPKKWKTDILIAYSFLAATAVLIVVHDANIRRPLKQPATVASPTHAPLVPIPLTRLADSPFLNPRATEPVSPAVAVAKAESNSANSIGKRNAPFGVYFLRVTVQATSEDGPVVFSPGTQVRLVRHQAGKVRVTRNGTDFLVEESQLTNDLDTVAAIAGTSS